MKNILTVFACAVLTLASCATVKQNIDARANLAKCTYDFVGVDLTDLKLSSDLLLDSVDFDLSLKVTNKSPTDVAVDHVEGDIFLDANRVLGLAHNKFTRIAPTNSSVEKIAVEIPFGGIIKQIGKRPDTLTVKAKIWLTLLVGKDTWETPLAFPISVTVKIPYDQIDKLIDQKKKEAQAALEKKAQEEAAAKAKQVADEAAKKASDALKDIKSPF